MNSNAHTRVAAASTSVVLAVHASRTLDFATAFAERRCAPILAFTRRQLESFGPGADIVVADHDTDPGASVLASMNGSSVPARVFLGVPEVGLTPHVDCLDVDMPPERVVAHALAIFETRVTRATGARLVWGELELDLLRRRALWQGRETNLTATQFDILAALVRARGAVMSKVELQRAVWPDAEPDNSERLLAHIRRIRMRLERDPARPTFLLTSRGVGFRLADPVEQPSPQLVLISTAQEDAKRRNDAPTRARASLARPIANSANTNSVTTNSANTNSANGKSGETASRD